MQNVAVPNSVFNQNQNHYYLKAFLEKHSYK